MEVNWPIAWTVAGFLYFILLMIIAGLSQTSVKRGQLNALFFVRLIMAGIPLCLSILWLLSREHDWLYVLSTDSFITIAISTSFASVLSFFGRHFAFRIPTFIAEFLKSLPLNIFVISVIYMYGFSIPNYFNQSFIEYYFSNDSGAGIFVSIVTVPSLIIFSLILFFSTKKLLIALYLTFKGIKKNAILTKMETHSIHYTPFCRKTLHYKMGDHSSAQTIFFSFLSTPIIDFPKDEEQPISILYSPKFGGISYYNY